MGGAASSGAGDGQPLALAAGEHHAVLADRGIQPARIPLEHLGEVDGVQHGTHSASVASGRAEPQVVADRAGQHRRILLDVADLRAKFCTVDGPDVEAAERTTPAVGS